MTHWCSMGRADRLASLVGEVERGNMKKEEEKKKVKEEQIPSKDLDDSWATRSDLTFSLQSIYTDIE